MTPPEKQNRVGAPYTLSLQDHHEKMHFLCQADGEVNAEWLQC